MNTRILSGAAGVLGGLALILYKLTDNSALFYAGVVLAVICFFLLGLNMVKKGAVWLNIIVGLALGAFAYGLVNIPVNGSADDQTGALVKGVLLGLLGLSLIWAARGRTEAIGSHSA